MAKPKKSEATKRQRGSVANAPTAPVAGRIAKTERKVKAVLNVPFRKLNAGDELDIEIIGPVRLQMMEGAGGTGKKKEPAVVVRAALLDSGALEDIICPTVMVSTLDRTFGKGVEGAEPGEDTGKWHGKLLRLICTKREAKRYMDVQVFELE